MLARLGFVISCTNDRLCLNLAQVPWKEQDLIPNETQILDLWYSYSRCSTSSVHPEEACRTASG